MNLARRLSKNPSQELFHDETASIIARFFFQYWLEQKAKQINITISKEIFPKSKKQYQNTLKPIIDSIGIKESLNFIKFVSPQNILSLYRKELRKIANKIRKNKKK